MKNKVTTIMVLARFLAVGSLALDAQSRPTAQTGSSSYSTVRPAVSGFWTREGDVWTETVPVRRDVHVPCPEGSLSPPWSNGDARGKGGRA